MRVLLLLCVSMVLLTGCRKKSSPEFFKLEADQSILVSRDGDEAWVSAEMNTILAGLQAIPEDALEKPRATALVQKITAEQARVESERVKIPPKAAPQPNPFAATPTEPTPPPPEEPEETPPAADQPDAGEPTQPWSGMEEKVFVARFGRCFAAPTKATLPDGRSATSYALNASPDCQKQHGVPSAVISFLFTDKGLWGKATETTQIRDAGTILLPPPPAPPVPPAPPPIITTPGAPLPEGYGQ